MQQATILLSLVCVLAVCAGCRPQQTVKNATFSLPEDVAEIRLRGYPFTPSQYEEPVRVRDPQKISEILRIWRSKKASIIASQNNLIYYVPVRVSLIPKDAKRENVVRFTIYEQTWKKDYGSRFDALMTEIPTTFPEVARKSDTASKTR